MTTVSNPENLKPQSEEQESQKKPRSLSNLLVRFITGMVILPIVIVVVFLGGWFLTVTLGILMLFEIGRAHV